MGGWSAWNEAHNGVTDAEGKLKAAEKALAECLGTGVPPVEAPPAAGGTAPPVGSTPDPPKTQEKPACKEGEERKTEVCRGTVTENIIRSLKLAQSGWFES